MSLSATEIRQVLEEIEPAIRHGWIQKVQQPAAGTLVFEIRVPGRTHRVLVSCQPGSTRIHLASRPLPNPVTPPPFCQFLRAHIQGARVEGLRQVGGDRIVEWRLTAREGPRTIMCQLTGRKATVLVLDESGSILKELHGEQSRIHTLYHLPQPRIAPESGTTVRFQELEPDGSFPLSSAIESYYLQQEQLTAADAARASRLRGLRQKLKRVQRRVEAWRDELAKSERYSRYGEYGELLKANLSSIKKGANCAALLDYFDDSMPEVSIPLDPAKTPRENMDDYFLKHRKYLTAERELRPRIEQAEREICETRREIAETERGVFIPTSGRSPMTKSHRQTPGVEARRGPFKRFVSADGLPIFVGRNARENDELTFGMAKSDDLWLHVRGAPGSHVVVRLQKGKDAPPTTLHEAAMLALLYSDFRKSGKGDVVYTRRKWLKRGKGSAPGAVTLIREQSVYISLDQERLKSLKARSVMPS